MTRGGVLWFFPLSKLFFSLLTRNKLFFSQAKEHALSPLHITPLFCQFCEDFFFFFQFAEQTIFLSLFAKQSFFFQKKT